MLSAPGEDGGSSAEAGPVTHPGLPLPLAALLLATGLLLHGGNLAGPFPDGLHGDCGAMFALMARNAHAVGWPTDGWVPAINAVPPVGPLGGRPERYLHHPPGLPWLVTLASTLPLAGETAARLVALLLTLATALLLADLAARLAGRRAALAAGLLVLLLPAGRFHGLLVNYETIALPSLLLLVRVLLLQRGPAVLAGACAALADWIALVPLLLLVGRLRRGGPARRRWLTAAAAAASTLVLLALLSRGAAPAAAPSSHVAGSGSALGGAAAAIQQGLRATALNPRFDASAWARHGAGHLADLYGWALVPAALGLALLHRRGRLLRQTLLLLLAVGVGNVALFAFHATSHESYALLLLPFVALSSAVLLFPRDAAARPPGPVGAGALALLLVLSHLHARDEFPARARTTQADAGRALAALTDEQHVYLRPDGASFVFLHAAARHVVPFPVADVGQAQQALLDWRARLDLPPLPGVLVTDADRPAPAWTSALGPPEVRDRFRFHPLPGGD